MGNNQTFDDLCYIMPIFRGLLAEFTDDLDRPYGPVILKSFTEPEAIDFAACGKKADEVQWPAGLKRTDLPPLYIGALNRDEPCEKIKEQLQAVINDYANQHGRKPQTICLRDLGVIQVGQQGSENKLALENKVALVTGAAGAIGYGICEALLENGCYLAASDLPGEKLDSFTADLKQTTGERVIGVALDVTDETSVEQGFESVIRTWGGIDIVVVNAGIAMVSDLKDMNLEDFRRLEKVNVEGTLLTLRQAARHFTLQGTGGDIIVISTKNVPCPGAGFGAYSATKAACHQLGRIASLELAQYGVRVNMVAPDAVFAEGRYKSGLWEQVGPERMKARGLDEKQLQQYYQNRNLLKAKVTARHVANAVLFFATRQTPTTGATIPVDGGLPEATPR